MRMLRIGGLGVVLSLAAGCQLYWTKPAGTLEAFSGDHRACVRTVGAPPGEARVLVNLDMYRACLRARGWERVTASSSATQPGMFRGLEEEGPVGVDEVPQQVPTVAAPSSARSPATNFGTR